MAIPANQGVPQPQKPVVWLLVLLLIVASGVLLSGVGLVWYLVKDLERTRLRALDSRDRMIASNLLKRMAIALQNYAESNQGQLPPAVVVDDNGKPLYSGRVLLLPHMEQGALYDQFDKTKAWDSPENLAISQTKVPSFVSPRSPRTNPRQCDFVFVSGPGTAFDGSQSCALFKIPDGLAATLLVVETTNGPQSWAEPVDWDATSGPLPPGFHQNITIVAFANGSVQQLQTTPPHPLSRALSTIAGGEAVD